MQKILMIYVEPTPYILGLIKALREISLYNIDILFLNENLSQNWNLTLNTNCVVLPNGLFKKLFSITTLIFKSEYTIIHVAGWGSPLLIWSIIVAKLRKKFIAMESDTSFSNTKKLWKNLIKQIIYPKLFSTIDLFFPGGKRQTQYLKFYKAKLERIFPAKMTVDVTGIKLKSSYFTAQDIKNVRCQYDIHDDDIVFIFVGRLEIYKGIEDLYEAFNKIKQPKIKLLFVGDGSCKKMIEKYTLFNSKVKYAGRLNNEDLMAVYHAADVLVLPSHFEPWGLVVNEAMAFAKPVIVTDSVGCADDLVVHGVNGMVVKTKNIIELQHAMEYIANDLTIRKSMGYQSSVIIADWTLENEALKIEEAWGTLV